MDSKALIISKEAMDSGWCCFSRENMAENYHSALVQIKQFDNNQIICYSDTGFGWKNIPGKKDVFSFMCF